MEIKPEQWKETEERVNEAEKAKRKAVKSSRELKKETGLIHKERDVLTHEEILDEESDILKTVKQEPSGSELEALEDIRIKLSELDKKKVELIQSSPEA